MRRGYPGHGPRPYRRLIRRLNVVRLEREIEAAKVRRVRELHSPSTDHEDDEQRWCVECISDWDGEDFDAVAYPCRTIRALDGDA